jgi:hypothetical protein
MVTTSGGSITRTCSIGLGEPMVYGPCH